MKEQDLNLDLPVEMFRSGKNPIEDSIQMLKISTGEVKNVPVSYTKVGELLIYEGDIVLNKDTEDKSRGIGKSGSAWPEGKVYYTVKDPSIQKKVADAIKHWEERTPIRFENEIIQGKGYISFEKLGGCWSQVGYQGKAQTISLDDSCGPGGAIHEIGHALGLWHEQSREDRDKHIKIVWENIVDAYKHNFNQHILDGEDLGPYDYGSIMHYPKNAFSKNKKDTILTITGQSIGQRDGLSSGDIAAVKALYPKLDWKDSA